MAQCKLSRDTHTHSACIFNIVLCHMHLHVHFGTKSCAQLAPSLLPGAAVGPAEHPETDIDLLYTWLLELERIQLTPSQVSTKSESR